MTPENDELRDIHLAGTDGQQTGPYTETEVQGYLREGRITPRTSAWSPRAPQWQPLGALLNALHTGMAMLPPENLTHFAGQSWMLWLAAIQGAGLVSGLFLHNDAVYLLLLFVTGSVFLGLYFTSRRYPFTSMLTATAVWCAWTALLGALYYSQNPDHLLLRIGIKLLIAVMMFASLKSAYELGRRRREAGI